MMTGNIITMRFIITIKMQHEKCHERKRSTIINSNQDGENIQRR